MVRKSKKTAAWDPAKTLVGLITKLMPSDLDFERMKYSGVKFIKDWDYEKFVKTNVAVAAVLEVEYPEKAALYRSVCEVIIDHKIHTMDLEPCIIWTGNKAFFNDKQDIVVVTPR